MPRWDEDDARATRETTDDAGGRTNDVDANDGATDDGVGADEFGSGRTAGAPGRDELAPGRPRAEHALLVALGAAVTLWLLATALGL